MQPFSLLKLLGERLLFGRIMRFKKYNEVLRYEFVRIKSIFINEHRWLCL